VSGADSDPKVRLQMLRYHDRKAFSLNRNQRRLNYILPVFGSGKLDTDAGNKFVYTCKYGWVDMGHFFRNANAEYKLFRAVIVASAWALEVGQNIGGWRKWEYLPYNIVPHEKISTSGFAVEDLVSNYQGRRFGAALEAKDKKALNRKYLRQFGLDDEVPASAFTSISGEWERFLKDSGAVKWDPYVQKLIRTDLLLYQGHFPKFPKAHTRAEGLSWQKAQKLYECLCNGDKPKLPQHRF
jgi:hypothetical protein